MDIQKISNEIATLKRAVKTAATASLKDKLKKKVESLNQVLKDANVPAKKLAMMLLGAKRKVASYTTAEFNAVIKRLSYKAEYTFLKGLSKVEIKDDLERHAKNPGWRFKGKSNFKTPTKSDLINDMGKPTSKRKTYYESRSNRSDVTNPAKLKKGGGVGDDQLNVVFSRQDMFEKAKDFYENESAFYPSDVNDKFRTFVFDIENGEADVTEYYLEQELQDTDLDGYYFEIADKMKTGGGLDNNKMIETLIKNYSNNIKFEESHLSGLAKDSIEFKRRTDNIKEYKKAIEKLYRKLKMETGGVAESENKEMVLNDTQQIEHHAEELENAVNKSKHVPAWVVAKVHSATTDISDATHYLDGVNTMPKEQFERIYEEIESHKMADGGGLNSFMDKQMHVSKVCKNHGCSTKDYLNAKNKYEKGGGFSEAKTNKNFNPQSLVGRNVWKNSGALGVYKVEKIKEIEIPNNIKMTIGTPTYSMTVSYSMQDLIDLSKGKTVKDLELLKENKMATGGGVDKKEGLYVIGRTREDNTKIGEMIEAEGLYAEWNPREGYWFFEEQKDMYDALEKQLENHFAEYGINARFEGIFAKGGGVEKKKKTDFTISEYIQLEKQKLKEHNAQAHEDDRLDWADWKSELTKEDAKEYGIYYNSRMLNSNGDRGVFEYLPTNKNYSEDEYAKGGITKAQSKKVGKVMHEWKAGKLHSGSKKGPIVKDQKQAVAIALSEAGLSKKEAGGELTGWKHKK